MTKSNRGPAGGAMAIAIQGWKDAGLCGGRQATGKRAARRTREVVSPAMNAVTRSQALLVSAHAARLALSIVIASLLGRGLSAADFGFVALLSSLYIVAVEILDMGTTAAATREIAARPARERETLSALLALRRLMAAAALAAILLLACSDYVPRPDQRIVLVAAAAGVFLLHLHAYQLVFQLRQAY